MHIDSPGLLTDLAILELEGAVITDCGNHLVIRTDANPSFYWGNFFLLEHPPIDSEVEGWVSRFETEFPQAHHRAFALLTDDGDAAPWLARGYESSRNIVLTASALAPAPLDPEVAIRPIDDSDAQAVIDLAMSEEESDDDGSHRLFEERRTASQLRLVDTGHGRWFGAFLGDRLVSKAGIVPVGDLARYQDVITHRDVRRRGIAGAVVTAAGEWALGQPGVKRLVIVAEEGGPAIGLYRRLGFTKAAAHLAFQRS